MAQSADSVVVDVRSPSGLFPDLQHSLHVLRQWSRQVCSIIRLRLGLSTINITLVLLSPYPRIKLEFTTFIEGMPQQGAVKLREIFWVVVTIEERSLDLRPFLSDQNESDIARSTLFICIVFIQSAKLYLSTYICIV